MTDQPLPPYRPAAPVPAPPAYATPERSPSALTVEDAREQAVRILTDRYADDSLTEAEFEARLASLSAAASPSEVQAVVADVLVPRTPLAALRSSTGALPSRPHEERMLAVMSQTRRTGQWIVPDKLLVRSVMSEVVVDLRYAIVPSFCVIDVLAVMANVTVIVPPDLVTDCDIQAVMGAVNNDLVVTSGWRAPVRVRLTGTSFMAEVKVQVRDRNWIL
jgi:hypothetical protein